MMQPEIANTLGKALQQEVSTLLENLDGMTGIIEENFSQIKDVMQSQKKDVIQAITREKDREIENLKSNFHHFKEELQMRSD